MNKLPASMLELLLYISMPSLQKIIDTYGGVRISIPDKLDFNHQLCLLIGEDDFYKLVTQYGCGIISVPRCVCMNNSVRNKIILMQKRKGLTISNLARNYSLTERAISNILRKAEDEEYKELSEKYIQFSLYDDEHILQ